MAAVTRSAPLPPPTLPPELVAIVAKYAADAAHLCTIRAVCSSWRAAVLANGADLWRTLAVRQFPRLAKLLALSSAHPPVSFERIYREQMAADTQRTPLRSKLSDYLFTFTLHVTIDGSEKMPDLPYEHVSEHTYVMTTSVSSNTD